MTPPPFRPCRVHRSVREKTFRQQQLNSLGLLTSLPCYVSERNELSIFSTFKVMAWKMHVLSMKLGATSLETWHKDIFFLTCTVYEEVTVSSSCLCPDAMCGFYICLHMFTFSVPSKNCSLVSKQNLWGWFTTRETARVIFYVLRRSKTRSVAELLKVSVVCVFFNLKERCKLINT